MSYGNPVKRWYVSAAQMDIKFFLFSNYMSEHYQKFKKQNFYLYNTEFFKKFSNWRLIKNIVLHPNLH